MTASKTLRALTVSVLALSLSILIALPAHADEEDNPVVPVVDAPVRVAPVVLKIPSLGVNADIVPVGEDPDGAMDVPPNPDIVAWWSLGYGTGETGNVVLAGHVNWDFGARLGVFGRLRQLQAGDEVVVVDERLREYHYAVTWSRQVTADGAPIDEFFGDSQPAGVTLITCGGAFDVGAHMYVDRIIVRAVKV
jgi:hypothetical protein